MGAFHFTIPMSALSNKDFRKFVPQNKSAQEEKSSADDGMLTFAKLSANEKLKSMREEISQHDNVKKSRKKNPQKKKKEKVERNISPTPRYRDRAKERREGKTEDIDIDEFLQSQADQGAPISVFGETPETSLKTQRALLQNIEADRHITNLKTPTSLHQLIEEEANEDETVKEMDVDTEKAGDPRSLGNRILNVLHSLERQQVTPITDVFLQGRSSYVFDTTPTLGHDIPTTLIRSKADSVEYYGGEELPYAPSLAMQEIVIRCMKDMKESRERPERKIVLQTKETEASDSDDDDIFADAGDCDNMEKISQAVKEQQESATITDAMETDDAVNSSNQRIELERLSQSQMEEKRKALQREEEWTEEYFGPKSKGLRQEEYTNFAFDAGSDEEVDGKP